MVESLKTKVSQDNIDTINETSSLENITSNLSPYEKLDNQNNPRNISNHMWTIQHNQCLEI